ncbi:MAG: VRR-NUC domain-containing protein [Planctomycetota bacterium]|jgi:hypothetical protein
MTEAQLQMSVAKMIDRLGWCYFHPVNEGKRRPSTGRNLKRQGMKKGVPDVLVFEDWEDDRCWQYSFGVAIELKAGKGDTTPEQEAWLAALDERGWLVAVCRTMDEVMDVLRHVRPLNGRRLR